MWPMIYAVNFPKLAYLWSLMSEVKCVKRNQHMVSSIRFSAALSLPHWHKVIPNTKWTQTFLTQHSTVCTLRRLRYNFSMRCVNFSVNRTFCSERMEKRLGVDVLFGKCISNVPCFMLKPLKWKHLLLNSQFVAEKKPRICGILFGKRRVGSKEVATKEHIFRLSRICSCVSHSGKVM